MIRPRAGGDRYRALARKWGRATALPFAFGAVSGCTSTLPGPAPGPRAGQEEIVLDLYLIGDAGLPDPDGEPVLIALERMVAAAPERSRVVFLGDNVYPDGIPDAPGPERVEAERILTAQLNVLLRTGTPGAFIGGNHGWDRGGPDGWREIVLQERFVEEHGGGLAAFRPDRGCPGPAVEDVGEVVRLVYLDTQWWLHPHARPLGADAPCPAATDSAVAERLRAVLRDADGRPVVVLAHHPLVSGGLHGAFPLLPERFSLRPGFTRQDLAHPAYRRMRRVLEPALSENPPLLYASGHDHSLQVIRGGGARYTAVSGAGMYGHTSRVRSVPGTLYARRASGFMRLSMLADGGARLTVLVVDASGAAREEFSLSLRAEPALQAR